MHNYKNCSLKMSLESFLTEFIINISVLRIINIDDVTSMFSREDQCGRQHESSECIYIYSLSQAFQKLYMYSNPKSAKFLFLSMLDNFKHKL